MTNQEKYHTSIEKKQQKIVSGKISERFPGVSSITIKIKNFHGDEHPIIVLRTFKFLPDSYAYFNIGCLRKSCIDGGFNLSHIITKMISSHKYSKSGELSCCGTNLSRNHSYIHYDVDIRYEK
ncbi:MAG: hypothetical protein AB1390_05600 [Nitrospirota bacterium]